MNIKEWLEQASEPVADTVFLDPPNLPFIVFLDFNSVSGADLKNLYTKHDLRVERYSEDGESNTALEKLFNDKALKYTKEKIYIDKEGMFEEIYLLDFIEKL